MDQAKSQVRGSKDRLLSIGTLVGWAETRLCDLEARVAEQEAQIAALQCQVYLDEEAAECEVTLLLDEGGVPLVISAVRVSRHVPYLVP
jgi:hypothetical protein